MRIYSSQTGRSQGNSNNYNRRDSINIFLVLKPTKPVAFTHSRIATGPNSQVGIKCVAAVAHLTIAIQFHRRMGEWIHSSRIAMGLHMGQVEEVKDHPIIRVMADITGFINNRGSNLLD
jgi:hypothetical protein